MFICSKSIKEIIRTRCETCPKLTIKTPERCHWCQPVNIFHKCSSVSVVDFEQVNARSDSSDHFDVRLNTLCQINRDKWVYKVFNLFYFYIPEKFNLIIVMAEEGINHWRRCGIQNTWPWLQPEQKLSPKICRQQKEQLKATIMHLKFTCKLHDGNTSIWHVLIHSIGVGRCRIILLSL